VRWGEGDEGRVQAQASRLDARAEQGEASRGEGEGHKAALGIPISWPYTRARTERTSCRRCASEV